MDKQRQNAYTNLIKELLNSSRKTAVKILNTNTDLLDADLLQMLRQLSEQKQNESEDQSVNELINLVEEIIQISKQKSNIIEQVCEQALTDKLLGLTEKIDPIHEQNNPLEAEILKHFAEFYKKKNCEDPNSLKVSEQENFSKDNLEKIISLGLAYKLTGQYEKAYTTFKSASETLELLTTGFNDQLEEELWDKRNEIYVRLVEVCIELAHTEPKYYTHALEYAERNKAYTLIKFIKIRSSLKTINSTQSQIQYLSQELKVLQQQLFNLKNQILHDRQNELYQTYDELEKSSYTFDQLLSKFNSIKINKVELTFNINFSQIKENIPDDQTAIIEWFITSRNLLAFIVTRQSEHPLIWRSKQTDKTLDTLIDLMHQYLSTYENKENNWKDDLASYLSSFAENLYLDEIASLIPETVTRIILIPHAFLHLLPLHSLPLSNQNRCFLDHYSQGVIYLPNCQFIEVIKKDCSFLNLSNFFAVQNPTEDLAYANVEVETISRYFESAHILKGKNASKKEVINQVSEIPGLLHTQFVHFSCHGNYLSASGYPTGLTLADHLLTLEEIFDLNFSQSRLVTLSACETGIVNYGGLLSSNYASLASSFLVAGSHSVVSSLWFLHQLSTSLLMIKFYENLQTCSTVAIALNQAQLWLRDVTTKELNRWVITLDLEPSHRRKLLSYIRTFNAKTQPFESPYYWAGFFAMGQ